MGNGASDTGSTTTVNVKPATNTQNNSAATTPRRREFREVEIRQSPGHTREQVTQRRGAGQTSRSDAIHRNEQANGGASGATPRQQQPQQRVSIKSLSYV